jgi:hypothetical protein
VERAEGETEGFLRAYFHVTVQNMRPCEIHVRLLQSEVDVDGLHIGTVQITPRAVPRTKRDEGARPEINKMSHMERRNKNKAKKNKNKTSKKLKVHEFTSSSAAALQENVPVRQAVESQERQQNKKPNTKKNKKDISRDTEKEKPNGGRKVQKEKKAGRKQRRKDRKNKLQGLAADGLRQKSTLRASEEAFENPIQIDLIKQRKPKSANANLLLVLSNQNEASDTAKIGEV